jgi:transposase-like protein
MVLSREEKEKLVLDLYYNKGYTYRQLAKELKMSPNQIRDIIRRHEEKNNAIGRRSCLYLQKLTNCILKVKIVRKWR